MPMSIVSSAQASKRIIDATANSNGSDHDKVMMNIFKNMEYNIGHLHLLLNVTRVKLKKGDNLGCFAAFLVAVLLGIYLLNGPI